MVFHSNFDEQFGFSGKSFGVSSVNLDGGLERLDYTFPYIGNFIIPTDELIFFRGIFQPPTGYYMEMMETCCYYTWNIVPLWKLWKYLEINMG